MYEQMCGTCHYRLVGLAISRLTAFFVFAVSCTSPAPPSRSSAASCGLVNDSDSSRSQVEGTLSCVLDDVELQELRTVTCPHYLGNYLGKRVNMLSEVASHPEANHPH